jgi:sporulation protein YlmC with PRC-barrel domain
MASIDDPKNTSGRLIAADQVQGTYIYNPAGDSLGSVEDVMIDKVSGRIAYAVVGFGGFLGPSYATNETAGWQDPDWGRRVDDYYGAHPYWDVP